MDKLIGVIPVLTPKQPPNTVDDLAVRIGNGVVVLAHGAGAELRTIWLTVSSCELLENALRISRRELERRNK
jgi:predicted alpha/beta-hydrolase family hydrolase